jgi:hypothetical protein
MPRSPRIVPGAEFPRIGRAHHVAHDLPGVLRALDHGDQRRGAADERHELVVERLADVLGVVLCGGVGVDHAQFRGDDAKQAALEAGKDVTDQAPLDGIGLADHESAVHGGGDSSPRGGDSPNAPWLGSVFAAAGLRRGPGRPGGTSR